MCAAFKGCIVNVEDLAHDVNLYLNFAVYAVLGRMAEADAVMRLGQASIERIADRLAVFKPIEPKPIYRGVLLDPDVPFSTDPRLTFTSWSEERDVARWFASTDSIISEPLVEEKPSLRGYLFTLPAPTSRVLFHHSWANAFGLRLSQLAFRHPYMGREGAQQIAWALATQHEVITVPIEGLVPEPIDVTDSDALDQRLAPPWFLDGKRSAS